MRQAIQPQAGPANLQPAGRARRRSGAMTVLIAVLIILVILVAVMLAATLSTAFNNFIAQNLHIDIQAEIALILRFFEHIRR